VALPAALLPDDAARDPAVGRAQPGSQSDHKHQRAPNFAMTHVIPLKPDYLYQVRYPGELIQIKLMVDSPRVNRGKGTF
jgi:hypothetical protein